jgi:hypothetical protein
MSIFSTGTLLVVAAFNVSDQCSIAHHCFRRQRVLHLESSARIKAASALDWVTLSDSLKFDCELREKLFVEVTPHFRRASEGLSQGKVVLL